MNDKKKTRQEKNSFILHSFVPRRSKEGMTEKINYMCGWPCHSTSILQLADLTEVYHKEVQGRLVMFR